MSDFVVSARKYRPQTFDSVVGQSSITNTLKNSIKTDHLAQAFLFCGTRGVGKTTTARILAKTINCLNRKENIEPCEECDSCKSFNEGQSLNIYELDAASNNSVDDIRGLVDQVRIAPQLGSYKVYIIDEVHMLSTAAFNAFLKTLEEPPKHAIFILATTEKHKIIPTILSRCQIFDFHRIKVEDMVKHLEGIAQKESVTADHDGLTLIAQKAEGGLRDALSLFDQIVSSTGGELTYENVIANLNILDYDYFFKIVEFMLSEDIPSSMLLFDEILERGFDGQNFLMGLAEHFRNLMICKDPKTHKMLEVGEKIKEKYLDQAEQLALPFIMRSLGVISNADVEYRSSKNKRLLVEITIMQLCSIKSEQEKKKSLTDPVPIIPFPNQPAKEEKKIIPLKKSTPQVSGNTAVAATTSPEVQTKKEVKIVAKSTPNLVSKHLSISKVLNPENQEEDDFTNTENKPRTEFDIELAKKTLKKLAYQLQSEGRDSLASTLTTSDIELKPNHLVYFKVSSTIQKNSLEQYKTEIVSFLRRNLENWGIEINYEVVENQNPDDITLMTSVDKFKKMAEKNPDLLALQKRFKLDIDF